MKNIVQFLVDILDQKCVDENIEAYLDDIDVVFFATPQGVCAKMVNENVLSKVKVIDLSADYRIKNVDTYEKWYGIKHASPEYIKEAVYGLCEINRKDIKLLIQDAIQHVRYYQFILWLKRD